jgi:hypothetical protein
VNNWHDKWWQQCLAFSPIWRSCGSISRQQCFDAFVRVDKENGVKNAFSKSMSYCGGFNVCVNFPSLIIWVKVKDILCDNLDKSEECLHLIECVSISPMGKNQLEVISASFQTTTLWWIGISGQSKSRKSDHSWDWSKTVSMS